MSRRLTLTKAAWESVRRAVRSGRRTDALHWLQRYLRLATLSVRRRAQAEALTGWLYLSQGEYGRARNHLRRALLLQPRRGRWAYWLGCAWAEDPLGGPKQAIRWFRRAVRWAPQQTLFRAALGEALIASGKHRQGLRQLSCCARQAPGCLRVLARVVHGAIRAGRPTWALRMIHQARFLRHTPAAVRQLEEWVRRLRFEQVCRRQSTMRGVIRWAPMPLRVG
jgi:tetratricopeptide (TPR) repeat protein